MECTRRVHIWGAYNKLHLAEGMLELKLHFITFSRKISSSIVFMVVYQEIYSTKHSQRLIFHGFYLSSSSKKSFTIETWFLIGYCIFPLYRSTKSLPSNWHFITVLLERYLTSWLKNSHFSPYLFAFRRRLDKWDKCVIKSWNVSTTTNLEDCRAGLLTWRRQSCNIERDINTVGLFCMLQLQFCSLSSSYDKYKNEMTYWRD